MAAKVTKTVVEAIIPRITYSPSTPTGVGVTQVIVEAIIAAAPQARVTQVVMEAIFAPNPDGSHGDAGGSAGAATHAFGYAV